MSAAVAGDGRLPAASGTGPGVARSALAILWRDLFVTWRELPTFAAQVILQPLFLLFVFGKVLGSLGYTRPGYAQLLLPGVIALTAFLTALQTTALPLVIDFSFSKEIEDRLLAPTRTSMVALEKIVFSTLRALFAAVLMFPLGILVLGHITLPGSAVGPVIVFLVLGALTGSAIGLTLGTLVTPARLNIVFALVLTPILFTGATQYPWRSLSGLRWFQVVTACNPLTYVSEGMRSAMTPAVPHLPPWVCVLALLGFLAAFTVTGVRGFLRRALD